jgi:hypothetical protein
MMNMYGEEMQQRAIATHMRHAANVVPPGEEFEQGLEAALRRSLGESDKPQLPRTNSAVVATQYNRR